VTQSLDVDLADFGLLTIQRHSEEEDGNFYDSYLDQNNVSRSLTPSPNVQLEDDEFREDSKKCVDRDALLALPALAELEDRLRSIQSKKRSRSSTVTLQNMYEREPGHSDNDLLESDDELEEEQYQTQSSGSSEWEPQGKPTLDVDPHTPTSPISSQTSPKFRVTVTTSKI
jgi:hypothetical protein